MIQKIHHRTEVRFSSFFSSGFITAIVVNTPERKLAKRTSVHRGVIWGPFSLPQLEFKKIKSAKCSVHLYSSPWLIVPMWISVYKMTGLPLKMKYPTFNHFLCKNFKKGSSNSLYLPVKVSSAKYSSYQKNSRDLVGVTSLPPSSIWNGHLFIIMVWVSPTLI